MWSKKKKKKKKWKKNAASLFIGRLGDCILLLLLLLYFIRHLIQIYMVYNIHQILQFIIILHTGKHKSHVRVRACVWLCGYRTKWTVGTHIILLRIPIWVRHGSRCTSVVVVLVWKNNRSVRTSKYSSSLVAVQPPHRRNVSCKLVGGGDEEKQNLHNV